MWCGQLGGDLYAMPHRSEYNGVVVPTHSPICACEDHQNQVHDYLVQVARRSGSSLAILVLVIASVMAGGVSGVIEISAAGLVLCGVWSISYPYATPETVRRFGVVNAVVLVRWLGVVILIAGFIWLGLLVAGH